MFTFTTIRYSGKREMTRTKETESLREVSMWVSEWQRDVQLGFLGTSCKVFLDGRELRTWALASCTRSYNMIRDHTKFPKGEIMYVNAEIIDKVRLPSYGGSPIIV